LIKNECQDKNIQKYHVNVNAKTRQKCQVKTTNTVALKLTKNIRCTNFNALASRPCG